VNEWISVAERMPEPGTECIVWSPGNAQHGPFAYLDTWCEQRECPVSFSTVSVPTGLGWDSSDYDEISHWMPLPPPPVSGVLASGEPQPLTDDELADLVPLTATVLEPREPGGLRKVCMTRADLSRFVVAVLAARRMDAPPSTPKQGEGE
jgi:hypothetical protein